MPANQHEDMHVSSTPAISWAGKAVAVYVKPHFPTAVCLLFRAWQWKKGEATKWQPASSQPVGSTRTVSVYLPPYACCAGRNLRGGLPSTLQLLSLPEKKTCICYEWRPAFSLYSWKRKGYSCLHVCCSILCLLWRL